MSVSAKRKQELKDLAQAVGLASLVHLGFVLLLVISAWEWPRFDRPDAPVRVTLVDMGPMVEQRRADEAAREAAEQQREQEIQRQREAEQQRQRELEQQRQREEQARQREAERQQEIERRERELAEQRAEQQRREAEAQRQRELEQQRQRELERQQAEQERRQAEQERERELEELRRQREEAQRQREEQERRLAELAERRAAEEAERQAAQEAERLRLAAEQAAADARRATLGEEYVSTIRELVRRNWNRPPTTRPGVICRVRVVQIPGGEIIAAEIVRPCNADEATRRSITAAVLRVGELPYRGYESVFAREIDFDFRYDG
jgi:colicin import membrane protein